MTLSFFLNIEMVSSMSDWERIGGAWKHVMEIHETLLLSFMTMKWGLGGSGGQTGRCSTISRHKVGARIIALVGQANLGKAFSPLRRGLRGGGVQSVVCSPEDAFLSSGAARTSLPRAKVPP